MIELLPAHSPVTDYSLHIEFYNTADRRKRQRAWSESLRDRVPCVSNAGSDYKSKQEKGKDTRSDFVRCPAEQQCICMPILSLLRCSRDDYKSHSQ